MWGKQDCSARGHFLKFIDSRITQENRSWSGWKSRK